MTPTKNRVVEEALSLPTDARSQLVEELLTSLILPIDAEIDHQWADEVQRRIAQLESGKAKLIPGDLVFTKIREKYSK